MTEVLSCALFRSSQMSDRVCQDRRIRNQISFLTDPGYNPDLSKVCIHNLQIKNQTIVKIDLDIVIYLNFVNYWQIKVMYVTHYQNSFIKTLM